MVVLMFGHFRTPMRGMDYQYHYTVIAAGVKCYSIKMGTSLLIVITPYSVRVYGKKSPRGEQALSPYSIRLYSKKEKSRFYLTQYLYAV
jgi:hypothetical protein